MAPVRVAYFVSSHGFGHAARAAAVMESLGRRVEVGFDIVTTTPEWFFEQSLSVPWRRLEEETDVGLVQTSPLEEDAGATVERLEAFWSALPERAAGVAATLCDRPAVERPRLVVSDISPLGTLAAEQLGVPSVLIENFGWDWIYEAYLDVAPGLQEFGRRHAAVASRAELHIQCSPCCRPAPDALAAAPVARASGASRMDTRSSLGIEPNDHRPLVLLTLGGLGWGREIPALEEGWHLATLGGRSILERQGRSIRLPDRSPVYPPDLVAAADVVVAKLGYSTVAECFRSGTRMAYLTRPRFPESAVLEDFVIERLPSVRLETTDPLGDDWSGRIAELLERSRPEPGRADGAEQIARRLTALLADREADG